ncbi:MAG: RsmB/NOP family class I SAM-dependent RNA methyltransferase [Bacteroidales bacterium]|nr:RsmB/NOP family class I SAM-dependent RNA methyltransferase [Bacteroidales bacterium]
MKKRKSYKRDKSDRDLEKDSKKNVISQCFQETFSQPSEQFNNSSSVKMPVTRPVANRGVIDCKKVLPQSFEYYLREAAGDSTDKIIDALLNSEPTLSIRLNPFKPVGADVDSVANDAFKSGDRVPWCANGYYLSQRPQFTFDPALHAGAYYVQEPSSMFLEMLSPVLQSLSPRNVLDLCAAPGGKSTHLISMLPLGTLITVNEVVKPRLSALRENILKWGVPGIQITSKEAHQFAPNDFSFKSNHISNHNENQKVTSNSNININPNASPSINSNAIKIPNRTAEYYLNDFNRIGPSENFSSDLFDFILVDAPCSGEGMFRKDPVAISEWSEENVMMCAARQKKIVREIWGALRPGGLLAYSTCTFNRYENDMNVAWMKRELGASIISLEEFYKSQGLEHIFSDKIREEWGIMKSE